MYKLLMINIVLFFTKNGCWEERDGNGKMQEDIFNEMLMSHGIETEPM